ncbi:PASTA domain-containing protein [Conexibacter stalactiti]|uniref:PASTA domain-containing protein n=1 Tax=Conexibacter stalactiti TaxID=1940611 RepID=UPI00384A855F
MLRQLDCKIGKVTQRRSASVPKGAVISTQPGRGLYRAGSSVRIVVSSGKPPRKAARRR